MVYPTSYNIGRCELFYLADELKTYDKGTFAGTAKTIRNIVKIKKISESDYAYANLRKKQWNVCDVTSRKAHLLLSQSWVDSNISKQELAKDEQELPQNEQELPQNEQELPQNKQELPQDEQQEPQDEQTCEKVPITVDIPDEDKFKDVDGNILSIETVGELSHNGIYFRVKDVATCFDMSRLTGTLTNKDNAYKCGVHYKVFICKKELNALNVCQAYKRLYLTYTGMIKVLFCSHNKNAEFFQHWASKILYTRQMGKVEEKEELASNLLNVNVEAIRAVFKSSANTFPCVYLFELGTVGDLRETFHIPDNVPSDMIAYKYGMTENMERRIFEHNKSFGRMKNVHLKLKSYSYVEPRFISTAEADICTFFEGIGQRLLVPGYTELVFASEKQTKMITKQYKQISNEYAGTSKELQNKIEQLEQSINTSKLQHELDIVKMQAKLDQTVSEKTILQCKIDQRDMELMFLKKYELNH
jgi:hypothetical protein